MYGVSSPAPPLDREVEVAAPRAAVEEVADVGPPERLLLVEARGAAAGRRAPGHLGQAYRKLEISGRGELAAALAR